ncbi:MAG: methyltransferase domain-containing protein [Vicinamibacterales bacterium]
MATHDDAPPARGMAFDADAARRFEAIYQTPDAARRRLLVRDALALQPGERVIDVGTGPGFLARDMAGPVGQDGGVLGVDTSDAMLARARDRCADVPWVRFESGDASQLPVDDATFDAAASVQVFEFIPDVDHALGEMHRVLKPGGRAVVVATDWDSILWHSADRARMARVLDAFGAHCPHTDLPRTLGPRLRRAGLAMEGHGVITQFTPVFAPDTYAASIMPIVAEFVAARGGVASEEARAWLDEQHQLARDGAFFFCLNQFLFQVRRPV